MSLDADAIFARNAKVIPGGVVSINRATDPRRLFTRAQGAYLYDHSGRRFIDYHAAFSPYFLGHGRSEIDEAVIAAIRSGQSLMGAGTTTWEGELAELLVDSVPSLEQVELTNSGSEATYFALRIARAATGRDRVCVMQGGYNGWHNDVAFNLMDPLAAMEGHQPGTPHRLRPFSAGMPSNQKDNVVAIEYNDLAAAEAVLGTGTVAAIILEPILQNIGIVKPQPGYLQRLREICDRTGTLLIFDEVKTGFRHALGGYQSVCGVMPDLSTFGKAVANGYPLGVLGGKARYMGLFATSDPAKRVLMAGTYNGHPVPVAAAIACLKLLRAEQATLYPRLEALTARLAAGTRAAFAEAGITVTVVQQASAYVTYFMDHAPLSWTDIARHHDMALDKRFRNLLADEGIFHFPLPTKQGSVSAAHSEADIDETIAATRRVAARLAATNLAAKG